MAAATRRAPLGDVAEEEEGGSHFTKGYQNANVGKKKSSQLFPGIDDIDDDELMMCGVDDELI